MARRRPNLFIIGMMKAGTTSLYTYLNAHPDLSGSSVKEPNTFQPTRFREEDFDLEAYLEYFAGARDEAYVFEASPTYINGKRRVATFIKQTFPDSRAIVILRSPVDRTISNFKFLKDMLRIDPSTSLTDYIARNEREWREQEGAEHRRANGIFPTYAETVPEWLDVFGDDLWIGFFDDLKADPAAFTDSICQWLGVRPATEVGVTFSIENLSIMPANRGLHRIARGLERNFEAFWRANPWLKRTVRNLYFRINRSSTPAVAPTPAEIAHLEALFRPSNAILRDELARRRPDLRLPPWLAAAD